MNVYDLTYSLSGLKRVRVTGIQALLERLDSLDSWLPIAVEFTDAQVWAEKANLGDVFEQPGAFVVCCVTDHETVIV
jgi:hypothetical protein